MHRIFFIAQSFQQLVFSHEHEQSESLFGQKKDESMVDNRSTDRYCNRRMRFFLQETHLRATTSQYSTTLELARKDRWATSGPDHQANHQFRTSRLENGSFSTCTMSIIHKYFHATEPCTPCTMHTATRMPRAQPCWWQAASQI